jgi:7-cyano-7-deazaguanine synthase
LRLAISMEQLTRIGGSSLTDNEIPVTAPNLTSLTIPSSYVPFRNAHLLATAVSWAEVIGASAIYIGAVAEDSSGYPDCRPEFYEAFQNAIDLGTKPETHIEIRTPVIHMRKSQIVRKGVELGAPLHLTWSCYQESELACGNCDSCALRLRAFREAGVPDPIPYLLDSSRFAY